MKILLLGLVVAIIIFAFKTAGSVMAKIKTPGLSGNAVGQWFKNTTGNIGWLLAIGGQAFCLILIWQCFPEFFGHWLKTNGFWFIQLGFVISTLLLKYAKPQVVGVIALLLTLACLLVSMVSASKEMIPAIATQAKTPPFQLLRNQREKVYYTNMVLVVTSTNMTNRRIPFGKGCDIEVDGKVYAFKNGTPLRDENGNHVVLNPGDDAKWGRDCSEVGFKSAESNSVVVTLHYFNAM